MQILDYMSKDISEIQCPFIIPTTNQSINVQCECAHKKNKGIGLFDYSNLTMNK